MLCLPCLPWLRLTEVSLPGNRTAVHLQKQGRRTPKLLQQNRKRAESQRHPPYPGNQMPLRKRHQPLQQATWRCPKKKLHSQLQFFPFQNLPGTTKERSRSPGRRRINPLMSPGRQPLRCRLWFTTAAAVPNLLRAALCSAPTCSFTGRPRSPWCASTATSSSAPSTGWVGTSRSA